jgi:hypothetical protein
MSKPPVSVPPYQAITPRDGDEEIIAGLKEDLVTHRQIVLALSDLVYLQNRELSRLKALLANTSLWTLFLYAIRRQPVISNPAVQATLTPSEFCYHPGIQIRLKKESLWRRYFTANSRRLRGKYHQKYEACVISSAANASPADNDARMLAKQYTSILSQRGI